MIVRNKWYVFDNRAGHGFGTKNALPDGDGFATEGEAIVWIAANIRKHRFLKIGIWLPDETGNWKVHKRAYVPIEKPPWLVQCRGDFIICSSGGTDQTAYNFADEATPVRGRRRYMRPVKHAG